MLGRTVENISYYELNHNLSFCYQNGTCRDALFYYYSQSHVFEDEPVLKSQDAAWILTSAIIIFTMQTGLCTFLLSDDTVLFTLAAPLLFNLPLQKCVFPSNALSISEWPLCISESEKHMVLESHFEGKHGFGLLEAGSVSVKSEVNIMAKNALDVVFGGIVYYAVGFAFSFGEDYGHNGFIGVGHYFIDCLESEKGYVFALFLFQLSFATTSTTIVSGSMVERTELLSYNIFSMCMTFIYTIPAHWMWGSKGFLMELGALDIAGCGPVHMVGGTTGIVATLMLGPRLGAFDSDERTPAPSPLKCILGLFMLWWGWLRFNSGSVFIVSEIDHWTHAVRAAVNTMISSMAGGYTSVTCSLLFHKFMPKKFPYPYDCGLIVNGILGSLVGITAACTFVEQYEAYAIGVISVFLTIITEHVVNKLRIDDPVGVIPVHFVCGIWGLIAVGLFIQPKESAIPTEGGLFRTGQFYMLGIQLLSALCIGAWTACWSFFFLKVIDMTIGLRLPAEDEALGADLVEHGVGSVTVQEHKAADDVLSITNLAKSRSHPDLKGPFAKFFREYYNHKSSEDLHITICGLDSNALKMVIYTKDVRPVDSGQLEVHFEEPEGLKPPKEGERDNQAKSIIHVGPTRTHVDMVDDEGKVISSKTIPYSDKGRRGSGSGMEAGVCAGVY